jgi:hypothetical protein
MSEIVFIEPNDEEALRPCAIVLEDWGDELYVAMAHYDVRLAGRLDLILEPSETLPCALVIFTHAVAWVPRDRVASTFGTVSDNIVENVWDSRAGIAHPTMSGSCNPLHQLEIVTEWLDLINELTTNNA